MFMDSLTFPMLIPERNASARWDCSLIRVFNVSNDHGEHCLLVRQCFYKYLCFKLTWNNPNIWMSLHGQFKLVLMSLNVIPKWLNVRCVFSITLNIVWQLFLGNIAVIWLNGKIFHEFKMPKVLLLLFFFNSVYLVIFFSSTDFPFWGNTENHRKLLWQV